jgi:drug/metabolite transporter (DMT)-like permease
MTASEQTSSARSGNWLANQPYLLLSITALCWAGNAIVGRMAAGHIAPVTLSFLRWSFAFLIILPFAWRHLVRDWGRDPQAGLGVMIVLSITGIGAFNYPAILGARAYPGAEHAAVAVGRPAGGRGVVAGCLLGVRLTLAQAAGVLLSMAGV